MKFAIKFSQSLMLSEGEELYPISPNRFLLLVLLIVIPLIIICIAVVDVPVVYWANDRNLQAITLLKYFTYLGDFLWFFSPLFFSYGVIKMTFKPLSLIEKDLFWVSLTILISSFFKDSLKFVFGRSWPTTWQFNNPSLLHDHVYTFHFFHWDSLYQSFPSGHATLVFTAIGMLWVLMPRARLGYILAGFLVLVGLVGMQYHYVSDVIAGAGLGLITAKYSLFLIAQIKKPLPQ